MGKGVLPRSLRQPRPRRETRRYDSEKPISSHGTDVKLHIKHPTRVVPDLDGFSSLSKTEIKRDIKDIEKRQFSLDIDSDDDDGEKYAKSVSLQPGCMEESTLYKKHRRILGWLMNQNAMDLELQSYRSMVNKSREEYEYLEREEDRWCQNFEFARHQLSSCLNACKVGNANKLEEEKKLMALLLWEISQGGSHSSKKKRSSQLQEILQEYEDRELKLELSIKLYEKLALEAIQRSKFQQSGTIDGSFVSPPQVTLSIDEIESLSVDSQPPTAVGMITATLKKDDTKIAATSNTHIVHNHHRKRPRLWIRHYTDSADDVDNMDDEDADSDDQVLSLAINGSSSMPATPSRTRKIKQDIMRQLSLLDDTIRAAENDQFNLTPFFQEAAIGDDGDFENIYRYYKASNPVSARDALSNSLNTDRDINNLAPTKSTFVVGEAEESALVRPFIKHGISERDWAQHIQTLCRSSSSVSLASSSALLGCVGGVEDANVHGRSRRKNSSGSGSHAPVIRARAFASSRTPVELPLLISPLSQLPDRYIGVGHSSGDTLASAGPDFTVAAENAVMTCCDLVSEAVACESAIRRLSSSCAEWTKQTAEMVQSLRKAEQTLALTISEDMAERRRFRRHLVSRGIIASCSESDLMPNSPVFSNRLLASKAGVGSSRGGNNKRGSSKGGSKQAALQFRVMSGVQQQPQAIKRSPIAGPLDASVLAGGSLALPAVSEAQVDSDDQYQRVDVEQSLLQSEPGVSGAEHIEVKRRPIKGKNNELRDLLNSSAVSSVVEVAASARQNRALTASASQATEGGKARGVNSDEGAADDLAAKRFQRERARLQISDATSAAPALRKASSSNSSSNDTPGDIFESLDAPGRSNKRPRKA